MTIDYLAKRPQVSCDSECFPNAWMIGFKSFDTGKIVKIAKYKDLELDRTRIATIMRNHRIFTFNGLQYDIPMITLAMSGASVEDLKRANDYLIPGHGLKSPPPWEFYDKYDLKPPPWIDHIDLLPIGPSAAQRASLKKYAGMMHSETMMEYTHDFNTPLNDETFKIVYKYLDNDLHVTQDMAEELTAQIEIRNHISVTLGVDVRSRSDAQVGEETVRYHVTKRKFGANPNKKKLYRPDIVPGPFKYEAPDYIQFETPMMQNVLSRLLRENFVVRTDGYVQLPELFSKKKGKQHVDPDDDDGEEEGGSEIVFGGSVYKMGIGGLHSQEAKVSWVEDDEFIYVDRDVTSYYPNMILRSGREPDNMRGHFMPVYQAMVDARIEAKRAGDKNKAEAGKIAVNGLFGKTGSPWSIVYAPKMMIQTTVTGQLAILMAIEGAEQRGWKVISANTDGFVTRVPRKEYGLFTAYMMDWELQTGLQTEEVRYRSIHSASVNSYFAIKYKTGKDNQPLVPHQFEVKRKSAFAFSGRGQPAAMGLKKTPMDEICYDAVVENMLNGTPIEETIRNCQDIRKFVSVRQVQGGACDSDGEIIGKVVRYYYADGNTEPLRYINTGNRVPNSAGAQPCMVLPKELPRDIDYEYYEREAYAIMDDCGMDAKDPTTFGRTGTFFGVLEEQKTVHKVEAGTAIAVCGMKRKHRRQDWHEMSKLPNGARYCSKCRKSEEL